MKKLYFLLGLTIFIVLGGCNKPNETICSCTITSPQDGSDFIISEDIDVLFETEGTISTVTVFLDDTQLDLQIIIFYKPPGRYVTIPSHFLTLGKHIIKVVAQSDEGTQAESSITINIIENETVDVNKVLMLKVDYLTNTFEGGIELEFSEMSETFTITKIFAPPGDFGFLKLFFSEIDELLFYGTIIWAGCGKMIFPEELLPTDQFQTVPTEEYVFPKNGFENVFKQSWIQDEYESVWDSVQSLVKVRQYLTSNPEQVVKLFLYTPSVGIGDPADADWFLFLKN